MKFPVNNIEVEQQLTYRIVTQSFIAKLAALKLGSSQVAIVLGKTIYLCNCSREEFIQNPKWLRHELCHIEQFKKYGFISFILKYLWESVRHGYYNNKYEVEARKAEDEI